EERATREGGASEGGRVDECLALDYSDSGFVQPTLDSVREWTFEPVRIDGVPVPSTSQVAFRFRTDGTVVVSIAGDDIGLSWQLRIPSMSIGFRTRDLRDLDAIPRPIQAPAPAYSAALARQGHTGSVTVHFYIDPTGAVRLPSVDPGEDQQLAALAIAALQRWRFEPPRYHNHPAQVRASQVFVFQAPAAARRASGSG
ncbi:MAG: TonB family protein, partial [Opitutaceae bacterium]